MIRKLPDAGTRWVILSRGERQAREAMEEGLKLHLRAMNVGFEAFTDDFRLSDNTVVKALEVVTKHGSRVTALPANPDTARGFSANVFLDEFAFHADSRRIWTALFPVISKPGLKLRVVSTPNGKGNRFYELMTSPEEAGWSKHVVDIYQAVADGLPRDIGELKAGCGDEDAWAQEYELKWLDEASAWLSYDLINAAENDRAGLAENYAGGPCYVGVDIGRRHDLFVIVVLEKVGDVLWVREIIERRGATFAEQDFLLDGVMRRYRRCASAWTRRAWGKSPWRTRKAATVPPVWKACCLPARTSSPWRRWAGKPLEDRRIRIPISDALRSDLHKLRKVAGPTGAPRFVAESDASGHADRTWALFLAIHAAAEPAAPVEFRTASDGSGGGSVSGGSLAGPDPFAGMRGEDIWQ